jgi:A/G-specific adenine glycosylase
MKRPARIEKEKKLPASAPRRRKTPLASIPSPSIPSPIIPPPFAQTPAQAEQRLVECAAQFRSLLKPWYQKHARVLPWRGVHDPYATWLSEIMLQQTRVATVIDRYQEFLLRFPTIASLASAPEAAVLALWSGLGYYRRARMLHRGAQFVVRELEGVLPRTMPELRTLPGVGLYTSAAIASIAFGERVAVVDGNVERVLLRLLGLPAEKNAATQTLLQRTAQALIPSAARQIQQARRPPTHQSQEQQPQDYQPPEHPQSNPPGDHNQAMMELGATICLPRAPLCLQCPVFRLCATRGAHPTPARAVQQSRTVAHLLSLRKAGTTTEVLLERRSRTASRMPGMLELPPLSLEAVAAREPVLRVRHAITNTNYYVQVFSESGVAVRRSAHEAWEHSNHDQDETQSALSLGTTDDEPTGRPSPGPADAPHGSLLNEVPAAPEALAWTPCKRLHDLPLTGLTRKVLQRLGVMTPPIVKAQR